VRSDKEAEEGGERWSDGVGGTGRESDEKEDPWTLTKVLVHRRNLSAKIQSSAVRKVNL